MDLCFHGNAVRTWPSAFWEEETVRCRTRCVLRTREWRYGEACMPILEGLSWQVRKSPWMQQGLGLCTPTQVCYYGGRPRRQILTPYREHIRRRHTLKHSHRCIRCGRAFETTEELARHSKEQLPCLPSSSGTSYDDGLDSEQLGQLQKFRWSKTGSLEDYWAQLCRILFPALEDIDIPSPCEIS